MSYFLKNNQNQNHNQQSEWMIIDVYNIFTKQYNNMKNKYNNNSNKNSNNNSNKIDEFDDDLIIELYDNIKNKIINLMKNKNSNFYVVLVNDNIINNGWRDSILSNYSEKFTFKYYESRKRQLWGYLFDYYLSSFIKENKYMYISNYTVEFIDIVAILTKYIEYNYSGDKITIISSDSDFYQLINDNVSVLNMNGDEDVSRILSSGEVNLWFKIIKGVRNISSPVLFNISFINYFLQTNDDHKLMNAENYRENIIINDNPDNFRELNKQELYYFLHNLNIFKKILLDNTNYILNNQHIINKKLIDFNNIPIEFIDIIEDEFINIFKKNYKNNINKTKILNKQCRIERNSHSNNAGNNASNNNRFLGLEIDD